MKLLKIVSIVIGIGFAVSASAQDTLRFTLAEAINYAVLNNPQLESAQLNEAANQLKIKEVKSSALPQISASASGNDNFLRATQLVPGDLAGQPGTTIPVQFGTRFTYSAGVQLTQVVYNASLSKSIQNIKPSQDLYELKTFKTKEDLVYNIASIHVQMKMVEKQITLIEGNLGRMQTLMEITDAQFREGIIKKVDVDQLQVSNTNLQTQLSNVENNYAQLQNHMKLLMNINVNQPLVITDEIEKPVEVSLALNPEFNTELNIIEKQIELQQLHADIIKAGYIPTVSLVANFNRQWQTNDLLSSSANSGFNSGYYGINVSIPIFDGNKKKSQVAQDVVTSRQLELNKEYLQRNIETEFKTATDMLSQNQKVLKAQEANMKLAGDLYEVAKLSYTEGVTALPELVNAENGLREAQSQYLTALLQTNLAELETMRTSGQLSQLIKSGLPIE